MLSSKLDLCKSEWLELVFDDRNTKYGAYDLRKHYAANLAKALGLTILIVASLFEGYNVYLQHQPVYRIVPVINDPQVINPPPAVKSPVTPPAHHEVQPPANNTTIRYIRMVPTDDLNASNPPSVTELETEAIGPADHEGDPNNGDINITPASGGNGTLDKPDESTEVKDMHSVEVMPQFPGGEAAWQKFLQKHLHYPPQAIDAGIGGKVFISFIVETDGHLSDITLVRGVGYGLDDEAIRVMNIAPKWTPGIQNGRKVRVRYMMPFNFQTPTDNN
ncbi:MAG TPA: TonB family protein [Mucilaginibacter sp.]|jgi:protein TonB|nr:TonB family protein [Mucilaginibacter sp.]